MLRPKRTGKLIRFPKAPETTAFERDINDSIMSALLKLAGRALASKKNVLKFKPKDSK